MIQWNVAGDPEKSVQIYYREFGGNMNCMHANRVMVTGDSMHFDNTDDMFRYWFNTDCCRGDCCDADNGMPNAHPLCFEDDCYNQGGSYPYFNDNDWMLDDIENTLKYRVTGWIDDEESCMGGYECHPELDVYVEYRDGAMCHGIRTCECCNSTSSVLPYRAQREFC